MPAILHGPYQCGKTSLLYAMLEDLSSRGYDVFFVDLDDAIQPEEFSMEKVLPRGFRSGVQETDGRGSV